MCQAIIDVEWVHETQFQPTHEQVQSSMEEVRKRPTPTTLKPQADNHTERKETKEI
jgi:hypothetical protein